MRYRELMPEAIGVKKFKNMNHHDMIEFMTQNFGSTKVQRLGSGKNATVLKIGDSVYKFWFVDSAYEAFINYCQQHQGRKCLPKLLSPIKKMPAFFLKHENAPAFVKYIKLEHLDDITNHRMYFNVKHTDEVNNDQSSDEYENDMSYVTLNNLFDSLSWLNSSTTVDDIISILCFNKVRNYKLDEIPKQVMELFQTVLDLQHLGYRSDLHGGNFMQRGNDLVIIDPLCDENDVELNIEFAKFAGIEYPVDYDWID